MKTERSLKDEVYVTAISLALSAAIFTGAVVSISNAVNVEKPETFPYQLSVAGGEYVWHVAQKCATPDRDIREIVYDIEISSELKSAGNVQPGQFLKVPMYCIEQLTEIGTPR